MVLSFLPESLASKLLAVAVDADRRHLLKWLCAPVSPGTVMQALTQPGDRADEFVKAGVDQGATNFLQGVYLEMAIARLAEVPAQLFWVLGTAEPALGPYLSHLSFEEGNWGIVGESVERFADCNGLQRTVKIAQHSPTCPYRAGKNWEGRWVLGQSEACHDVCFVHWLRSVRIRFPNLARPLDSELAGRTAFRAFEMLILSCNELMARYPG
ncbi:MAG: hypothetical protein HZA54_16845 [Planctomycetes bacterium]|nr:hypothetical protein [Planctomycetota bacterium]